MARYIARRILWLFVVLFVVALITFTLMHLIPGGPWDREKQLAPKVVEALNNKYGLDKPLYEQFGNYLWGLVRGDLGISFSYQGRNVTDILMQGLPKTAILGTHADKFICTILRS